ncbi:SMI1/KNR4 family protein [Kitasatospora sp. NPDC101183]|uniref:SMI1/KNR4 family protein n=1 Tax=Kitasatospora sp. NPDC101183 TaxID=3364100 RepID=UPI0037F2816E
MAHPAITGVAAVLGQPGTAGDAVDWDELARTTGLRLPTDYREFIALYGGGELDEYLSINTPADGLVDGLAFDPTQAPDTPTGDSEEELLDGRLLPVASTVHGDVVFWVCDELDPERWEMVVFKRQARYGEQRWTRYAMGFGELLLGTLTGTLASPFSARGLDESPHAYRHWRRPL